MFSVKEEKKNIQCVSATYDIKNCDLNHFFQVYGIIYLIVLIFKAYLFLLIS